MDSTAEIVGVRLAAIEPLESDLYLELRPGVMALYGLNGSGKSRLLSAIATGEILLHAPPQRLASPDRPMFFEYDEGFDDLNRGTLWAAGVRTQPGDGHVTQTFAGVHDAFSRVAHPYDLAVVAAADQQLLESLQQFLPISRLPHSLVVRVRLWSILLGSVQAEHVRSDYVDLVIEALGEVAEQGFISLQKREDGSGKVAHRARLHEVGPLRRLYEASLEEVKKEFDGYTDLESTGFSNAISDAAHDGLFRSCGWLFRSVIEEDLERLVDKTPPPPWWFGRKIHGFEATSLDDYLNVIVESDVSLDSLTVERIRTSLQSADRSRSEDTKLFEVNDRGVYAPTPATVNLAGQIETEANALYGELLEGAPRLSLQAIEPEQWRNRAEFDWFAEDQSGKLVALEHLSSAQLRWARFAVQLALADTRRDVPTIVLLDEPERALHRRAERHMFDALMRIAERRKAVAIVATHSPHLLAHPDARLVHVSRNGNGRTTISTSAIDVRGDAARLGLDVADLLQLVRVVVLVEGEHDQVVLDQLFGDEFARHGVRVLPMRGAKALEATADAELLFGYTDVSVVVVLDNESTERVETIWQTALQEKSGGASSERVRTILQELRLSSGEGRAPSGEGRALQQFCLLAINGQASHRVRFQMLSKRDITEYFLPESFIRSKNLDSNDWNELRERHTGSGSPMDFKSWLSNQRGARFDERTLRRAVDRLDQIHPDFLALRDRVLDESARRIAPGRSTGA